MNSVKSILLLGLISISSLTMAEWAEDIPVGSPLPDIQATDQHGNPMDFSSLSGTNGLALFFNRSVVW